MTGLEALLHQVGALHAQGGSALSEQGVTITRLSGGANNALYRVQSADQDVACKLFVPDERRRAAREWGLLAALQAGGQDIAPQPLLVDETCRLAPFPAVIYRWLDGPPLASPVGDEPRAALLDSLQRLHACQPGPAFAGLPAAWFHWFDLRPYLDELYSFRIDLLPWLEGQSGAGAHTAARLDRLVTRLQAWLSASPAHTGRQDFSACLVHVDPNLSNTVWGRDRRLRWVDWEYGGWGDPALDLAEFRWHASLMGEAPERLDWLREHYQPPPGDRGFDRRLDAWDHILAVRWPFLIVRWMWGHARGGDRLRLSELSVSAGTMQARLQAMLARAEDFFDSN